MEMLQSAPTHRIRYLDDTVVQYWDSGIADIPELDEAMGSDRGEDFDFDGNLNT